MAEGFRSLVNASDALHTQADEYRELDDERVLVLVQRGGRGKTSGVDLRQMRSRGANLFHVCDGTVTKLVVTSIASARSPTSASLRRPRRPNRRAERRQHQRAMGWPGL